MDTMATTETTLTRCVCGAAVAAGARFCEGCGASLQPRRCGCGHQLSATARFCSACGAVVGATAAPATPSQPVPGPRVDAPPNQVGAGAGGLLSAPPWEQELGAMASPVPTRPAGPTLSPTPIPVTTPAPVIGHWKATVVELGAKLTTPQVQQFELMGGTQVMEWEYILAPDNSVVGKAQVQTELTSGLVFAMTLSMQTTGTWKYSARAQRLELSTTTQAHLDDLEVAVQGIGGELQDQMKRAVVAQLARPTKTTQVLQIERGDNRYFEARDGDDRLWRFERLA